MQVCPNCFSDKELRAFIETSDSIGNCKVCGSLSQKLLELSELYDFFQELISNFKLANEGLPLNIKIQNDWKLFSKPTSATIILNCVLSEINSIINDAAQNVDYTDEIIYNFSHWEHLKDELKWKNRYIIDIDRLGEGEFNWDKFLRDNNVLFNIDSKTILFRARLHEKSDIKVFKKKEMGSPPKEKSTGGRANPSGIPFLYLSEDKETVLHEVRASYHDEISLGKFRLRKDISLLEIVDFTKTPTLFQSENIKDTIQGKLLRDKISKDLSKPMRRYDSELDYIPTQFICEYIKVATGANGIRFKSSLHNKGNNIVLFDSNLMECKSVHKLKIHQINLTPSYIL